MGSIDTFIAADEKNYKLFFYCCLKRHYFVCLLKYKKKKIIFIILTMEAFDNLIKLI